MQERGRAMGNNGVMQIVLIAVLLLCGYFYLYQLVAKRAANRAALPLIAMVLFLIYALIAVSLVLILSRVGSVDFIFQALLVLAACVGAFVMLYGLYRNFGRVSKGMALLFFLYLLMVAYITVFSRSERKTTEILLRFDAIQEAIRLKSLAPLQHLWLNIVMFVPIGILFSLIDPPRLARFRCVLPLGLLLTAAIETAQLLLRLGQCDVEDMAANTLGACLGLVLFRLYRRFWASRIGPG